jgi:hypothetical protein
MVAILLYEDTLLPENITGMQRYDETDEVFVLLAGHCILFLGDGHKTVTRIHPVDMLPLALVWGWITQKTDGLWGAILFHAGTDIPVVLSIFSKLH